jgi:hypothetical protein
VPQQLPPLATFVGTSTSGTSPVALTFNWTLTPGTAYTAFKLQLVNTTDPLDVYPLETLPGNALTYTYPDVPATENFTATIIPEFFLQTATSSTALITAGNSTIPGPASVASYYNTNSSITNISWTAVAGATTYDIVFSAINPTVAETFLTYVPATQITFDDLSTNIYAACGLGADVTVSVLANFASGPPSQLTAAPPFLITPSDPSWFLTGTPINGQTTYTGVLTFNQSAPLNGGTFLAYWRVYIGLVPYGPYTNTTTFALGVPNTFTNSLDTGLTFDTGITYTIYAFVSSSFGGSGVASATFTV